MPKLDKDYDDYGITKRVRRDLPPTAPTKPDLLSAKRPDYYDLCLKVFEMIDSGDASIGAPPFNGGLFHRARSPLLNRARIGDRALAPLIDALSRTEKDGKKAYINYRDLSVRELGAVYERLLEYEPVADAVAPDGIAIRLIPSPAKAPAPITRPTSCCSSSSSAPFSR